MSTVDKNDFSTHEFVFERELAEHQISPIPDTEEEHDCKALTEGYCEKCGQWVDPAGGLHDTNDDDPASMYA